MYNICKSISYEAVLFYLDSVPVIPVPTGDLLSTVLILPYSLLTLLCSARIVTDTYTG